MTPLWIETVHQLIDAMNYDFDITLADLVTILTDERIIHGKPLG
jgi:hypothetical protein